MNDKEVLALLTFVEQASQRSVDVEAALPVWTRMLGAVDATEAFEAAETITRRGHRYAISVADILRTIAESRQGPIPSWPEVKSIIEHSHYDPDRLANAHPIVRQVSRTVGGAATLAALGPDGAERAVRNATFAATERFEAEASRAQRPELGDGTPADHLDRPREGATIALDGSTLDEED